MKRISQEEMTRKIAPYLYAEWLLLGSVFVLVFGLLLYWVFTEAISPFEFAGYAALLSIPYVALVLYLLRRKPTIPEGVSGALFHQDNYAVYETLYTGLFFDFPVRAFNHRSRILELNQLLPTRGGAYLSTNPPALAPAPSQLTSLTRAGRRSHMIGIDSYNRPVEPTEAVHAAFFGMTGMGKTTLIEHYLDTGRGFILFDCEGESSDRIQAMIPRHRTNDVIYIDPLADRVPGITFLVGRDLAILEQNVVHFFRNNWASSWGARSEWLIANLTYVLLASESIPQFGFASISKMLGSTSFRDRLGNDIFGKQFLKYFKTLSPSFRQEVVMPILNKVDMLVRNEHCRVIFGQSDSSFSFAEAMDRQQIIIVRIPAGELGDMTRIIGSAIFTLITREALLRKNREPYFMVLDELQEYTKGIDLDRVLATTRKYGLFALMAVTNMEQIDDSALASILANCGVLASFRTSARDAERLAKELGTDMQPRAIQELQQFSCLYSRRGERLPSSPVIVRVEPPREINQVRGERIKRASLRRWGRPRKKVLERIERYLA